MRRFLLAAALAAAGCPAAQRDPGVPAPPPGSIADPDLADMLDHFAKTAQAEKDPERRASSLATLGMAYQANSFDALAEECYRAALATRKDVPQLWYHLAFVLERQDKYDEAVAAARQAAALDPEYAQIHRSIAFWALDRGRLEEAEAAALKAVELSGGGAGSLIALGRVQMEQGRDAEALDTFAKAVAAWPAEWGDAGYVRFLHGTALRRAGREAEALAELARAHGEPTPLPDPWRSEISGFRVGFEADLKRAHRLLETGQFEEAVRALQELRVRRPGHSQVLTDLGSAYLYLSRWTEAIAVLDACVKAHPQALDPRLQLARALWAGGRRDDALRLADETVRANPESSDAFEARGVLRLRSGVAEEALADFEAARRLDPANPAVPALAGAAHLALSRDADAAAAFESARAKDPAQATAIAGLAMLALRRGDVAGADRLLTLIADRPDAAAFLVADARALRAKAGR